MRAETEGFILTRAELAALAEFACVDKTRTHIHAIEFRSERDSAVASATDGHTLALVRGKLGGVPPTRLLVPLPAIEQAIKLIKGQAEAIVGADAITIHAQGFGFASATPPAVIPYKALDEAFPPYHQVIPAPCSEDGVASSYNANYLARLAVVGKACSLPRSGHAPQVIVSAVRDPLDPVRFDLAAKDYASDWTVVLMPMRM